MTLAAPAPDDPPKIVSALQRRVQNILGKRDLLSGFSVADLDFAHSIFDGTQEIDAGKRCNVRDVLMAESIRVHSQYVDEYDEKVVGVLDSELELVENLEEEVSDAIQRLVVNRERITTCLDQSDESRQSLVSAERKLKTIEVCFDLFVVDKESVEKALSCATTSTGSLNPLLLDEIDKIEKKRKRCQILMDSVPNSQLARDCLSESVDILESVLEKLFLLIQRRDDHLVSSTSPQLMGRTFLFLQIRPHLFSDAWASFVQARGDVRGQAFVRSGMDLESFDPVQYISNLLSWLLEVVLEEVDYFQEFSKVFSPQPSPSYYTGVFSNVIEIISARVGTVLGQPIYSVVELFRLEEIFSFYLEKIESNHNFEFLPILERLRDGIRARMDIVWQDRVGAGATVTELVFTLEKLLDIDSTSNEWVAEVMVPSLIVLCGEGGSPDRIVACINNLSAIGAPLKKFPSYSESVHAIDSKIETQISFLVDAAVGTFMKKVGFDDSITVDAHPVTLTSRFRNFYNALITSGVGNSWVDPLRTRELRAEARRAISEKIATTYDQVYATVGHIPGVAAHSPEEVRALLDM
jgi:hypothetical protein